MEVVLCGVVNNVVVAVDVDGTVLVFGAVVGVNIAVVIVSITVELSTVDELVADSVVIEGRQTGSTSNLRLLHRSPRHCDTSSLIFIRFISTSGTSSLQAR